MAYEPRKKDSSEIPKCVEAGRGVNDVTYQFASTLTGLSVMLKISDVLKKTFEIKDDFSWTRVCFLSFRVTVEGCEISVFIVLWDSRQRAEGHAQVHDLAAFPGTMAWLKKNANLNEFASIDLSLASQSETRPSITRCSSSLRG